MSVLMYSGVALSHEANGEIFVAVEGDMMALCWVDKERPWEESWANPEYFFKYEWKWTDKNLEPIYSRKILWMQ